MCKFYISTKFENCGCMIAQGDGQKPPRCLSCSDMAVGYPLTHWETPRSCGEVSTRRSDAIPTEEIALASCEFSTLEQMNFTIFYVFCVVLDAVGVYLVFKSRDSSRSRAHLAISAKLKLFVNFIPSQYGGRRSSCALLTRYTVYRFLIFSFSSKLAQEISSA